MANIDIVKAIKYILSQKPEDKTRRCAVLYGQGLPNDGIGGHLIGLNEVNQTVLLEDGHCYINLIDLDKISGIRFGEMTADELSNLILPSVILDNTPKEKGNGE